jgi:hypothetical protein
LELLAEIKPTIKELGTSCVEVAYNEITGNDSAETKFYAVPKSNL